MHLPTLRGICASDDLPSLCEPTPTRCIARMLARTCTGRGPSDSASRGAELGWPRSSLGTYDHCACCMCEDTIVWSNSALVSPRWSLLRCPGVTRMLGRRRDLSSTHADPPCNFPAWCTDENLNAIYYRAPASHSHIPSQRVYRRRPDKSPLAPFSVSGRASASARSNESDTVPHSRSSPARPPALTLDARAAPAKDAFACAFLRALIGRAPQRNQSRAPARRRATLRTPPRCDH
jgi:hypothetical protein